MAVCGGVSWEVGGSIRGREGRGGGSQTLAFYVDGEPAVGLYALHDADFLLLGFEDGALLDVQLEVGSHGHCGVAGGRGA